MTNQQKILIIDSGKLKFASDVNNPKVVIASAATGRLETAGVDCLHLVANCTGEKKKPSCRQRLTGFLSGLSKWKGIKVA